MSDQNLHDLTGVYAVDALDEDERVAFEAHMTECEPCTREVAELRAAAAQLGAAQSDRPDPAVKSALMAQIRSTPQDAPLRADKPNSQSASVTTLPKRRGGASWWAVAASILFVIVLTLGAWSGWLYKTNNQLSAEANRVKAVLTAPDVAVASGPVVGGGRGAVVTSKSASESVFVASNLAQPASGKTYQLWYLSSAGVATSAGTFQPTSDGSVVKRLGGSTPASTVVVGLTVEPAGGSLQPTSKPISLIHVSA